MSGPPAPPLPPLPGGPPPGPSVGMASGSAIPARPITSNAAPSQPTARLSNRYVRRLVAEPGKACFVCSRPTTVVLVSTTAAAEDFFYACPSHLQDRHFATLLASPAAATASSVGTGAGEGNRLPDKVSQEEIDKIKREYEERMKSKKEADNKKEGSKKEEDKDKKAESQGWISYLTSSLMDAASSSGSPSGKDKAAAASPSATPMAASQASGTAVKGHEYYSLHRTFYAMRLDQHSKRIALKRARELNLPSVPKG